MLEMLGTDILNLRWRIWSRHAGLHWVFKGNRMESIIDAGKDRFAGCNTPTFLPAFLAFSTSSLEMSLDARMRLCLTAPKFDQSFLLVCSTMLSASTQHNWVCADMESSRNSLQVCPSPRLLNLTGSSRDHGLFRDSAQCDLAHFGIVQLDLLRCLCVSSSFYYQRINSSMNHRFLSGYYRRWDRLGQRQLHRARNQTVKVFRLDDGAGTGLHHPSGGPACRQRTME